MATSLSEFLNRLKKSVNKETSKTWKKGRAKCNRCGYEWNAVYLYIPGGEKKLQCKKCKARDSTIVG